MLSLHHKGIGEGQGGAAQRAAGTAISDPAREAALDRWVALTTPSGRTRPSACDPRSTDSPSPRPRSTSSPSPRSRGSLRIRCIWGPESSPGHPRGVPSTARGLHRGRSSATLERELEEGYSVGLSLKREALGATSTRGIRPGYLRRCDGSSNVQPARAVQHMAEALLG
jgi:hypothetical protein